MSFTIGGVTGVALCLAAIGVVTMASSPADGPAGDPATDVATGSSSGGSFNGDSSNGAGLSDDEALAASALAIGAAPSMSPSTTIAAPSNPSTPPVADAQAPVAEAPRSPGLVAVYELPTDQFGTNRMTSAIASGIVIDGLILTSAAALDDGNRFELELNGEVFEASLVGVDRYSDVAVLAPIESRLAEPGWLTPVNTVPPEMSSAAGDAVAIVAAAAMPQPELALGEVVATNEQLTTADGHHLIGAVLTTVRRIEGSDGAALVDEDGNTIAIVVSSDTYHAAAIPLHDALNIGRSLAAGAPAETWLGIGGSDSAAGVVITSVAPDGPAAAGGLLVGDTVTAVQGADVTNMGALVNALRSIDDPDFIELSIVRDGNRFPITVRPSESSP